MNKYGKTVHIRLNGDLEEKFEKVHQEYSGLPTAMVVKILLTHQLNQPTSELLAIVQKAITGKGLPASPSPTNNRSRRLLQ